MSKIQLLDKVTIDKIAAGEVIERPAAVVKELVENAIDAGANNITVEIKEGGISFIRITDNGCGISKEDIPKAFLRHATSKIRSIDDLNIINSLGFRGEALSSVSSVAQVELLTRTAGDEVGSAYIIHGGEEKSFEDRGVNPGTTFIIRQLFYNIPARRKFLKTASTEASHVSELITRLALSHPDVSFTFVNNDTVKLQTSGNGQTRDMIYNIYGRDIAQNILEVNAKTDAIKITGYIGKPSVSRGNRNYENYFINGRYVKSNIISKAIEDAYKGYAMQHRYPFTVLHIEMDTTDIDVNVHPTKMDLRFSQQNTVYNNIYHAVVEALGRRDMILQAELPEVKPPVNKDELKLDHKKTPDNETTDSPESKNHIILQAIDNKSDNSSQAMDNSAVNKPVLDIVRSRNNEESTTLNIGQGNRDRFTVNDINGKPHLNIIAEPHKNVNRYGTSLTKKEENENLDYFLDKMKNRVSSYHNQMSSAEVSNRSDVYKINTSIQKDKIREAVNYAKGNSNITKGDDNGFVKAPVNDISPVATEANNDITITQGDHRIDYIEGINTEEVSNTQVEVKEQLNLFAEKILEEDVTLEYRLIGQVFGTYWMIEYDNQLYIIDQHAAHEKVLYENTMNQWRQKEVITQYVSPPMVLTLSMQEQELIKEHMEQFTSLGFEVEEFGMDAYAIRGIPANLFGVADENLFIEMLDDLGNVSFKNAPAERITEKVASMSCKAAVKGNNKLSAGEMDSLIGQLLKLDNPFHCPHGRPTIIAISKKEMEKKFKRIV